MELNKTVSKPVAAIPKPKKTAAPVAVKPSASGFEVFDKEAAMKLAQEAKQKNDARRAEVEQAVKEMEEY